MIFVAAAFFLSDVPPAPSGVKLPPGSYEVLDPIAPAHDRYVQCVDSQQLRARSYRELINRAIRRCASVRAKAVAEADATLARVPGYEDPVRRQNAIRHAFEGYEEVKRGLLDRYRQEQEAAVAIYKQLSRKLSTGRFQTTTDAEGRLTDCKVTNTTGDGELDAGFCELSRACSPPAVDPKAVASCMDGRTKQFMRELALKRASDARWKSEEH